ncbi:DM13 domain-containing protein [Paractinoplanes lichenicola]|uniref:DM13 domain-containing protein n=1 Tax=Paractinoplanes lichenicola TaxID=2802976 RepID=A0ABS1W089_9ACTN|nr:DM13 domain-containing protein [Actinoplanes lichenicola]MBL7260125.1 DM13 domain-containing protein [Actinoplanes lichenicola]
MTIRRPAAWAAATVLALLAGLGLYWFQPWKLVTDRQVDEALAVVPAPAAETSGPTIARQGTFISHEHDTRGMARVVLHPDGSRVLELLDLATSNGPDLRVWLSDQPVRPGLDGWRVFDDGASLELGRLKGNQGNQRYAIPPGTDLDRLASVAIWCKRFSVSFGAATLRPEH